MRVGSGRAQPHPHKTHRSPNGRILVLLLLITPICLAMQCYNEDLTQDFQLDLETDETAQQLQIDFPYTGRLSIDFSIASSRNGSVTMRTQAQTSGDPDVAGCDAVSAGRIRDVTATSWSGVGAPVDPLIQYPAIDNLSTRTRIDIPYNDDHDTYQGALEIATDNSLVRLYSTIPDISLWDLNGNIVPPIRSTQPATCAGVYVTIYEIPAQRTRLAFRTPRTSMQMVVLEDCAAHRVVENICPGSYEDEQKETIPIQAGNTHVGHYPEVGVGDILLVEGTCHAGACPATVTLFGRIETLDCQTSNDCGGSMLCTHHGYCVHESAPSCASTDPSFPTPMILVTALGSLALMRRRGARSECAR